MNKPLIEAKDLTVRYTIGGGLLAKKVYLNAVDNISISIAKGNFFGLVGESGSGKTTLGRALLRAAPIS
ncbi:MAG: ATP-binding cassette domain-containing protein, partial [Paracoccaceae bacterium]|nr:ATP-binding cassette domain-containing protein [Paracoccaceae bacterium]